MTSGILGTLSIPFPLFATPAVMVKAVAVADVALEATKALKGGDICEGRRLLALALGDLVFDLWPNTCELVAPAAVRAVAAATRATAVAPAVAKAVGVISSTASGRAPLSPRSLEAIVAGIVAEAYAGSLRESAEGRALLCLCRAALCLLGHATAPDEATQLEKAVDAAANATDLLDALGALEEFRR